MPHVVRVPSAPFLSRTGKIRVFMVPAAEDNLIWLLECTQTGEIAAVDGPDASGVVAFLADYGKGLSAIFNTHTHPDHIGINRDFEKRGGLAQLRVVGSRSAPTPIPGLTEAVGEGDRVRLGACEGEVLLTEGHIDGHVSYLFDGVLFCGDTLFGGGCGYLFDGPPEKMFHSLRRLAVLPGDTRVCCAHEYTQDNLRFAFSVDGANTVLHERMREVWGRRSRGECTVPSTIALERATNPFIRSIDPAIVAAVQAAMPAPSTRTPEEVFAATRRLKDRKDYRDPRWDEALSVLELP